MPMTAIEKDHWPDKCKQGKTSADLSALSTKRWPCISGYWHPELLSVVVRVIEAKTGTPWLECSCRVCEGWRPCLACLGRSWTWAVYAVPVVVPSSVLLKTALWRAHGMGRSRGSRR
jgi:hypothetical protein